MWDPLTLCALYTGPMFKRPRLCILINNKEWVLERKSTRLVRIFQQDGWVHVATKGSHWQFSHPAKPGRVTIPHPNKDIPHGTVASIYRQAGWDV